MAHTFPARGFTPALGALISQSIAIGRLLDCLQKSRASASVKTVLGAASFFYMKSFWRTCRWKVLGSLAGMGITVNLAACNQIAPSQSPKDVDLSLRVSAEQQGVYALAGQTNLPDKTPLVVMAIRQLQPAAPASEAASALPTYSILAYQPTQITQGQWQAQLKLWQVDADGAYREPWQIEAAKLNLAVEPHSEVQFVVTLGPQGGLASLEERLRANGLRLPRPLLRTTLEGDRFLLAEQPLRVPLPSGSTTPPVVHPGDRNGGWGDRHLLVPEPPLPYTLEPEDQRRTDAPATAEEYLF